MKDGIYYVVFRSNNQDFGNGTVVVKDDVINGGDFGFTYKGGTAGDKVMLNVIQHDRAASSVFGDLTNFNLNLTINEVTSGYQLHGGVEGMPSAIIQINAKFIGDLF